jgi:hypothetical protein
LQRNVLVAGFTGIVFSCRACAAFTLRFSQNSKRASQTASTFTFCCAVVLQRWFTDERAFEQSVGARATCSLFLHSYCMGGLPGIVLFLSLWAAPLCIFRLSTLGILPAQITDSLSSLPLIRLGAGAGGQRYWYIRWDAAVRDAAGLRRWLL